jgi:RNA-directed DNA polymerase
MDWNKYVISFQTAASAQNFDSGYVERCLSYAEKLFEKDLPIIYSTEHLSKLVGYDGTFLRAVAFRSKGYYRSYLIPKKSSGFREICEPLPNLKLIQKWILQEILYKLEVSPHAKAFVCERSIKDNARFHKQQKIVLTVDIKDFFPSISSKNINRFFLNCGYSKRVAYSLTRLTTLNGSLPQGAPTSPCLSNLIFLSVDIEIAKICKEKKIRYTRYADDLTFSGDFNAIEIVALVRRQIGKIGLRLNDAKTRVFRQHQRQIVTGVVVNEKLQAPREMRRELRKVIYYIAKFGLEYHISEIEEKRCNYRFHLMGQANFMLFLNPVDRDALQALAVLRGDNLSLL